MEKKKKKERVLSEAELRRVRLLEKTGEELEQQGYARKDLLIDINKANTFAVILLIPLFLIGHGLYWLIYREMDFFDLNMLLCTIIFLVLIVVHELIHGLSWSFFTPHGFKDIEFGIMKPSMNPYCTCLVPLKKQQHLIGTAMPLILLGIVPMIVALLIKDPNMLFIGILMTDAAAGDIMIMGKILGYKSDAKDMVYIDHPTEGGCVVFER